MTTCPIYIGCLSHSLLYGIILKDKCQYKATIPTLKILLGGPIIFRKKQNLEFVLVLMKIKKKCEESKQFSLYRLISNSHGYVEKMLANKSTIFSVKSQNKSPAIQRKMEIQLKIYFVNNIESNCWFWSKLGKPKSYGSEFRCHGNTAKMESQCHIRVLIWSCWNQCWQNNSSQFMRGQNLETQKSKQKSCYHPA